MTDIYSLSTVDASTPGFVQNPRADAWLKEATRLKSQRDMQGAIKALEAANIAISEGKTQYTVDIAVFINMEYTKRSEAFIQQELWLPS